MLIYGQILTEMCAPVLQLLAIVGCFKSSYPDLSSKVEQSMMSRPSVHYAQSKLFKCAFTRIILYELKTVPSIVYWIITFPSC